MEIEFIGGNALQHQVTRQAVGSLINFPVESMGMSAWRIEFVADPDQGGSHNEFAVTHVEEKEQGFAETRMRSDAPDFGPKSGHAWEGVQFYSETAIHELGHGLFWNLPASRRLAVCRLFGADTDDPDVIFPAEKAWADRIGEAIAETFKDAFLPPSMRRYYNRTNIKIPFKAYPYFRSLFRVQGSGRFSYLYGSSLFRVDLSEWGLDQLPYHESERDKEAFVFYEGLEEYPHGYGVEMSQFAQSGTMPFSIEPAQEIIG